MKVSVIVPVYNASKYITACLESLCNQTLEEVEIVLVDDHGQDDSMEIARRFVQEYKGPKAFIFAQTPRNSGPGPARNIGIGVATGKYMCFVDSDDVIDRNFCKVLYDAAMAGGSDLACCDIEIGGVRKRNPDTSDKKHFLAHFVSYFTTFAYRRQMLLDNGISFPPFKSAEDTCFLTCSVLAANSIAQVHEPLYKYILQDGSVSRRKNRRRAFQRLSSIRTIITFAKSHGYYRQYRAELLLILFKKGYLLALKDLITG